MADIAQEAGLVPDDNFAVAVSKVSDYLWQTAWKRGSGTVAGDADDLHDMRVALRRLRSALQNFEGHYPSRALQTHSTDILLVSPHLREEMKDQRRRLGRLGDALGAVRDYDVLDDYLKDYAKERLEIPLVQSPGLAHFERFFQTERAAHFAVMVKKVNRAAEPGGLRESFARWALGLPAASGPRLSFKMASQHVLPTRIDEVLAHSGVLDDSADEIGHHELRKSLRRLRYTLEIFAPCFGEAVKPHIKILVQLQDYLGEMQDRTVLRENAQRAFAHAELPDDATEFLTYGDRRRRQLLGMVRRTWRQQMEKNFFDHLRQLQV